MKFNNAPLKHLGGGVVLFQEAITVDWNELISISSRLIEEEWSSMYSPAIHPETGEHQYVNRSGFFFKEEDFAQMPRRAGQIHSKEDVKVKELLLFLEKAKYKYLLKYLEAFPLAYKCIWWAVKGHILEYKKGVYLGSHSDNSVEYSYGVHVPDDQLPLRSVLTNLVYFNSSVSEDSNTEIDYCGGEHYFNYLDIKYIPKKGDILMFPSNYMAAHEVLPVKSGKRYSYLGWYSQGTPNQNVKEYVADPIKEKGIASKATNVYLTSLREDFREYLIANGHSQESYALRLTEGIGH